MSACDVYLKNGYMHTDRAACKNFTIQISEPDGDSGIAIYCQTSHVDSRRTFVPGCNNDLYNLRAEAQKFPFGVTIHMDDVAIFAAQHENIIGSDSRKVFSLPAPLVASIIECIKKSRDVMGKKKNMLP